MNASTEGNGAKGQGISQLRRSIVSSHDRRSDSKSARRENVTQFAVRIFDESNPRRAVRIILDTDNLRRNTAFAPLEIHFAIFLFMTAANVP